MYNITEQTKNEFLCDLQDLIAIKSCRMSAQSGAPFGDGVQKAFQKLISIAKRLGFKVLEYEGYAIDIRTGDAKEYVGILCHIDTVDAIEIEKWDSHPYELTIRDGVAYGRGVNDDKGPLLACLYVMKELQNDEYLSIPIRLIVGGAEETTWECMNHYFGKEPQPRYGFSADGDFPIVNGEKGILKVEISFNQDSLYSVESEVQELFILDEAVLTINKESIRFSGSRAISRHPERGVNALVKIIDYLKLKGLLLSNGLRFFDEVVNNKKMDAFSLEKADKEMGSSSVALTSFNQDYEKQILHLDFRYTRTQSRDELIQRISKVITYYGGSFKVIHEKRLLYVPEDSKLIQSLKKAYTLITNEPAQVITKGGASYARTLDNGVAFGPTFENEVSNSHLENECIRLESLWKAMSIYYQALLLLAHE